MPKPKPKMSFQVDVEEKEILDAVVESVVSAIPALGDSGQTIVQRAAFRIGLRALAVNPLRAGRIGPLSKTEMLEFLETHKRLMTQTGGDAERTRQMLDADAGTFGRQAPTLAEDVHRFERKGKGRS